MATTTYTTKDGDVVDAIAWAYYGTRDGLVVEQVLAANKGLSDYGPILPAGVVITLPDIATTANSTATVKLWS
jgi:phage tail protein X